MAYRNNVLKYSKAWGIPRFYFEIGLLFRKSFSLLQELKATILVKCTHLPILVSDRATYL